jgi:hypothetical protein
LDWLRHDRNSNVSDGNVGEGHVLLLLWTTRSRHIPS